VVEILLILYHPRSLSLPPRREPWCTGNGKKSAEGYSMASTYDEKEACVLI